MSTPRGDILETLTEFVGQMETELGRFDINIGEDEGSLNKEQDKRSTVCAEKQEQGPAIYEEKESKKTG